MFAALILCSNLADAFNRDCKTPVLSACLTIAINSSRSGGQRKCRDSCMKDSAILNEGFLSNCCKSVCFKNRNLRAVALYSCETGDNDDDDDMIVMILMTLMMMVPMILMMAIMMMDDDTYLDR